MATKTLVKAVTACSIFLFACTESSNGLNVGNPEIVGEIPTENQINNYLAQTIISPNVAGQAITCSHELLNAKQGADDKAYVVAECIERPFEGGNEGAGVSGLPVLLELDPEDTTQILDFKIPRDGSLNRPDIERIFPESAWK